MTTDSIAARASFRHLQHDAGESTCTLVVPFVAEKTTVKPSTIKNQTWLSTIKALLQEGIGLGLFGPMKLDAVVRRAFQTANDGWCRAVCDSFLVRRTLKVRIEETVKKIFSDPERLCFAQLCYEFEHFLEHVVEASTVLEELCDRVYRGKKLSPDMLEGNKIISRFFKDLIDSYEKRKISATSDKDFISEKKRLIAHYFGKPRGRLGASIFCKLVVLNDEEKVIDIKRLQEKIHQFRQEILGGYLPSPAFTTDSVDELRSYQKSHAPRVIQVVSNQTATLRHIYTYFTHQGKKYKLDTASGLSEIKNRESLDEDEEDISEYRIFYR